MHAHPINDFNHNMVVTTEAYLGPEAPRALLAQHSQAHNIVTVQELFLWLVEVHAVRRLQARMHTQPTSLSWVSGKTRQYTIFKTQTITMKGNALATKERLKKQSDNERTL